MRLTVTECLLRVLEEKVVKTVNQTLRNHLRNWILFLVTANYAQVVPVYHQLCRLLFGVLKEDEMIILTIPVPLIGGLSQVYSPEPMTSTGSSVLHQDIACSSSIKGTAINLPRSMGFILNLLEGKLDEKGEPNWACLNINELLGIMYALNINQALEEQTWLSEMNPSTPLITECAAQRGQSPGVVRLRNRLHYLLLCTRSSLQITNQEGERIVEQMEQENSYCLRYFHQVVKNLRRLQNRNRELFIGIVVATEQIKHSSVSVEYIIEEVSKYRIENHHILMVLVDDIERAEEDLEAAQLSMANVSGIREFCMWLRCHLLFSIFINYMETQFLNENLMEVAKQGSPTFVLSVLGYSPYKLPY